MMNINLDKLGVSSLNPMQEEMRMACRRSQNIVLLSPTGSGKTLAYLLPLLESFSQDSLNTEALVLVPSRELAIQTQSVLKALTTEVRSMACYGGRPTMDEHRVMRELMPRVIIGTPGRILDHMQKENFDVAHIRTVVIDEFDKSLEFGFQAQMREILSLLRSVDKRVLLSATDNPLLPEFAGGKNYKYLNFLNEDEQLPDSIQIHQVQSPEKDKLNTLLKLLLVSGQKSSLVFVNYRESVERVGDFLKKNGIFADVFHGGMEQRDRERAIYRFSNGSCNVLVSTDLASRGLDIPQIDNVIHYHMPMNEEAFIHRNGRTARWDATGDAFLIIGPEEHCPEYVHTPILQFDFPEQIPAPLPPKWITLYIGKGKKNKINKIDVVGFLSKIGGLDREQLGRVDVLASWSFAAVHREMAEAVLSRVYGQKIKGQKTIVEIAE